MQQEVVLAMLAKEPIAATADRMITMRDGVFVDETRLSGGTTGSLARLAGLELES